MGSAFFISDVHLTSMASPSGEAMLRLLQKARAEAELFVVLGDLFDIWVGRGRAFQREYKPIIDEFRKLREGGTELIYFEGNHDFHLQKFWERELGVLVRTEPMKIDFHGMKIWAEHGDEINRKDYGYLFLRAFWRFAPVKVLIENIPSELVSLVGNRASKTSRAYTSRGTTDVKALFRDYAQNLRARENFDLLLTGHSHVPDDFSFSVTNTRSGPAESRLINLGSWFEGPHYLRVTSSGKVEHVAL